MCVSVCVSASARTVSMSSSVSIGVGLSTRAIGISRGIGFSIGFSIARTTDIGRSVSQSRGQRGNLREHDSLAASTRRGQVVSGSELAVARPEVVAFEERLVNGHLRIGVGIGQSNDKVVVHVHLHVCRGLCRRRGRGVHNIKVGAITRGSNDNVGVAVGRGVGSNSENTVEVLVNTIDLNVRGTKDRDGGN